MLPLTGAFRSSKSDQVTGRALPQGSAGDLHTWSGIRDPLRPPVCSPVIVVRPKQYVAKSQASFKKRDPKLSGPLR